MFKMISYRINQTRNWLRPALLLWLAIGMAFGAQAAKLKLRTEANVMVEQSFTASFPHVDPFNEVRLDVIFFDPQGRELRVPAFWDGGNVWKVRYASPIVGTHLFHTECSDPHDKGLQGIKGTVDVTPYLGKNPLYIHGPLHVSDNHRFLEHQDGTPFFWLGDTWWMGLSHRMHWPEDFQKLAADRKEKGFNVIQIVAGLYPDMFPFDPRGANEAGYPWETNYSRIRPNILTRRTIDCATSWIKASRRALSEHGATSCRGWAWIK